MFWREGKILQFLFGKKRVEDLSQEIKILEAPQKSPNDKKEYREGKILKFLFGKKRVEDLAQEIKILEAPQKSPNDKKEYRVIKLKNGLTALLVSDLASLTQNVTLSPAPVYEKEESDKDGIDGEANEGADQSKEEDEEKEDKEIIDNKHIIDQTTKYLSAASLSIGVGDFVNSREILGLMHFLEHMVFKGSEKYPKENCYSNFISKYGGYKNAHTDCENTTFYFDVQEDEFEKALDIFANFFISPLMKQGAMKRERKAVHSEFREAIDEDVWRKQQLIASIANENHPISLFHFGNLKTLKLKITDQELHSKLHEIRSKYYSAHYMTLVVQARESLDELQEKVVSIFSKIPNNNLPKPSFEKFGFPFNLERFHRFYIVIPVSNEHILELRWAMPPVFMKYYESKPLCYISYLIQHEGFGSIYSYLKKRVWAMSLAVNNIISEFNRNSTCQLFVIAIRLTDEGLRHIKEIIQVVFQYIRLLQDEGPNLRIFSEIQKMKEMKFCFAEEEPSENVLHLSNRMQLFPSKHILNGDSLIFKYDPSTIQECLSSIRINNCNIMLSTPQFKKKNLSLQKEEWFGTKYCVEDIPQDWIEEWENALPTPDLYLPAINEFIPDNFEVYKWSNTSQSPPQYPRIIEENKKGKIWFKQDFKFDAPKAYCVLYCRLQDSWKSAEIAAMLDLFNELFNLHVKEALYPIEMAQYYTSIQTSNSALILRINGFNQKLHKCLEFILFEMVKFGKCLDDKTFDEVKRQLLKSYKNEVPKPNLFRKEKLVDFSTAEKKKALKKTGRNKFISVFLNKVLPNNYITMLVQGNIIEEDAKQLFQLVVKYSTFSEKSPCPKKNLKEKGQVKKPVVCFKSFTPDSPNSSITNHYVGEKGTLKTQLLNEFIIIRMKEQFFKQLRTREQLGYNISCSKSSTYGLLGISLAIKFQANKYRFAYVDSRIELFLKTFIESFKKISEKELEILKNTLRNSKLTIDVTLKEEVERNFKEIVLGGCLFDRREQQISLISSITLEEVSEYLQKLICPENNDTYQKISVKVVGSSTRN